MFPTLVSFLSDEGDAESIDLDLLDKHRERIRRIIIRNGNSDSLTLAGGVAFLTLVDLPNGDYVAVSWFFRNDDEALVFAIAAGEVESPP